MAEIIAFANSKGGTGKTTTVRSIGGRLADMGRKVLLIDLDPQAVLSHNFHPYLEPISFEKSIVSVLGEAETDIRECIVNIKDTLDIVVSPTDIPYMEKDRLFRAIQDDVLGPALEPVNDDYDFILIDCPPDISVLRFNALSAADGVIIPTTTSWPSIHEAKRTVYAVEEVKERIRPELKIYGLLVTMFDNKSASELECVKKLESEVNFNVIGIIPQDDSALINIAYDWLTELVVTGAYHSPEPAFLLYPYGKRTVGRPKTGREIKVKKMITILPSVYNAAAEIAGTENKAMSELIEELLVDYIKKHR